MVRWYDVADQQMEQQAVSRSVLQLALDWIVPCYMRLCWVILMFG